MSVRDLCQVSSPLSVKVQTTKLQVFGAEALIVSLHF